jgi:two-component system OmpR family sensor kinase
MSLRARLIVGLVFVGVVLGLTVFLVTRATGQHLVRQTDSQLRSVSASGRERYGGRGGPDDEEQLSTLYYAELFSDGTLKTRLKPNFGSDGETVPEFDVQQLLAAVEDEPFTVSFDGSRWRVLVTDGPGHQNVTALSLQDVDDAIERLIIVELVAVVAVVGAMALVGWWVMRLGVRPIKQMTAVATDIAEGDLSHRVPVEPETTEAGQLGAALNKMLTTIEEAFEERRAPRSG